MENNPFHQMPQIPMIPVVGYKGYPGLPAQTKIRGPRQERTLFWPLLLATGIILTAVSALGWSSLIGPAVIVCGCVVWAIQRLLTAGSTTSESEPSGVDNPAGVDLMTGMIKPESPPPYKQTY